MVPTPPMPEDVAWARWVMTLPVDEYDAELAHVPENTGLGRRRLTAIEQVSTEMWSRA